MKRLAPEARFGLSKQWTLALHCSEFAHRRHASSRMNGTRHSSTRPMPTIEALQRAPPASFTPWEGRYRQAGASCRIPHADFTPPSFTAVSLIGPRRIPDAPCDRRLRPADAPPPRLRLARRRGGPAARTPDERFVGRQILLHGVRRPHRRRSLHGDETALLLRGAPRRAAAPLGPPVPVVELHRPVRPAPPPPAARPLSSSGDLADVASTPKRRRSSVDATSPSDRESPEPP